MQVIVVIQFMDKSNYTKFTQEWSTKVKYSSEQQMRTELVADLNEVEDIIEDVALNFVAEKEIKIIIID